jgi:putative membrane protein
MTVTEITPFLPPLNASLNGLSTVFIAAGWWSILNERKRLHIACMVSALTTSTLFLASYLTYHFLKAGHVTYFTHSGWPKTFYFWLLGTHTVLAIVVLPMVILTVIPALRARYDRHKRIGRWTMPIWLYVSVTGVLVYFMLYQWFPAVKA